MKYCSQCGNPLDDDMVFCPKCGTKHRSVAKDQIFYSEESNSNNSQNKHKIKNNKSFSSSNATFDNSEKIIFFCFNMMKKFFELCAKIFKKCLKLWKKLSHKSQLIIASVFIIVLFFIVIANSFCFHHWKKATCTSPKTCSHCFETKGNPLGHTWIDADCENPKNCSVCGDISGTPLGHKWAGTTCTESGSCTVCGEVQNAQGHKWVSASCQEPKHCSECGINEGEPSGHNWVEADCENAKKCSVCEETEGNAIGHSWIEATCTAPKTCTICNKTEGKESGHKLGRWIISKKATCAENGLRNAECKICGEIIEKELNKTNSHVYGDWSDDIIPTCTEKGSKIRTCTICGNTEIKSVAAIGHTYEESIIKEATFYEAGEIGQKCIECGNEKATTEKYYLYSKIKLSTVFNEYSKNPFTAEEKFEDMYVEFTATIDGFEEGGLFSKGNIIFEISNGSWWEDSVQCEIKSNDQLNAIKSYSVGSKITIKGRIRFCTDLDLYRILYIDIIEIG